MQRRTALRAAGAVLAGASLPAARAQSGKWPAREITLINPNAAGASTDLTARIIAQALEKRLQATVIVKNVVGGAGALGASTLASAAPDGYTMGMAAISSHVTVPAAIAEQGYAVRIGCHSDTLYHLDSWQRAPDITKSATIATAETKTASAFGGLVYIEVPGRAKETTAFTAAIKGAHAVHRRIRPRQRRLDRGVIADVAEHGFHLPHCAIAAHKQRLVRAAHGHAHAPALLRQFARDIAANKTRTAKDRDQLAHGVLVRDRGKMSLVNSVA
jgi:hypothetical protein